MLCGPICRVIFTVTQIFYIPVIALGSTQGCKRPCYLVTIRALVLIEPTARTLGGQFGIVTSQWLEVGFDIIGHCLWKGSLNKYNTTTLLKTSVQFQDPGQLKVLSPTFDSTIIILEISSIFTNARYFLIMPWMNMTFFGMVNLSKAHRIP